MDDIEMASDVAKNFQKFLKWVAKLVIFVNDIKQPDAF